MPSIYELDLKLEELARWKIDDIPIRGRNQPAIAHARTIASIYAGREKITQLYQDAQELIKDVAPGWSLKISQSPTAEEPFFELELVPPGETFKGITVADLVHTTRNMQEALGFSPDSNAAPK